MPRMVPANDSPCLSVAEIVELARAEFGFVNIDPKNGLKFVSNRLLGDMPAVDQTTADQRLLPLSESVEMIVGDNRRNDDQFLKCYVIPSEPIHIEFVDDVQARHCKSLIQRMQNILGYVVEF